MRLPLAGGMAAEVVDATWDQIADFRRLADGYTSFLWRTPEPALLIRPCPPDELSLARFQQDFGVVIVQRQGVGRVRVFTDSGIATLSDGSWTSRPYSSGYLEPLRRFLGLDGPGAKVFGALLDLCVHTLSPSGVGATIVCPLPGATLGDLDRTHVVEAPAFSVADPTVHGAVKSLLSQIDRAIVLGADGRLQHAGAGLIMRDETEDLANRGGTRHNSAQRYSAQQPEAVVLVVSSDGPVTVYFSGQVLVNDHEATWVMDWFEPCGSCNSEGLPRWQYRMGLQRACNECGGTGEVVLEQYVDRIPHRDHTGSLSDTWWLRAAGDRGR